MKNTDAKSLALTLGRQIHREIARVEATMTTVAPTDDDPFAGIAPKRSKLDSARRLKNLTGAVQSLGAAHNRYKLVEVEIMKQLARAADELNAAIVEACGVTGVTMESLAESLANVGDAGKASKEAA